MPDFLIIGAAKSGTTSLYFYLSQHPNIIRGYHQEIHFFDSGLDPAEDNFARGESWYRAHFPLRYGHADDKTFESSPMYIFHPLAPQRIYDAIPKVRLIAVLRNPTQRAISHYFFTKKDGNEPLNLRDALSAEDRRLKPALDRQDYEDVSFRRYSYKARGVYHRQLERFYRYFPPEQILVLKSESLFARPQDSLRQTFDFLGMTSRFEVPELRPHNVSTNREAVDPEIARELDAYFAPHNRKLYDLIGTDFGW